MSKAIFLESASETEASRVVTFGNMSIDYAASA